MDETAEAQGTVCPAGYVNIAPEIGGIVKAIYVSEGDDVKAGDTVLLLASGDLEFDVERTRQTLIEARARLLEIEEEYHNLKTSESYETGILLADLVGAKRSMEIAEADYERATKLFEKELISEQAKERAELEFELRKSNYRVLRERQAMLEDRYLRRIEERKRSVELARQAYELAEQKLARAVVISPIAGTVLTAHAEDLLGTKAVEGAVLVQIGDCSNVEFVAMVGENDIPKVRVGQEAKIFINAYPHRQYKVFTGRVKDVSSVPDPTKSGVAFECRIGIDEPWVKLSTTRQYLKPGLSGKAKIVIEPNVRLSRKILEGISK
ncbi:MAG: efflux RND transporter periplasmic adaptor subunit [Candidatus Zixiibacteriota bacterium]|nr:MAG: efflux RND transporter periplasmic adaptor subunit [candidate division Zixibacteria bacterium]